MSDATPAEAGQEKAAGAHYAVPKDGPDADVNRKGFLAASF